MRLHIDHDPEPFFPEIHYITGVDKKKNKCADDEDGQGNGQ
jgi:hypothetical protein